MNVNSLSQRLYKVAAYLPEGSHFADIGSDHAYLPCYVCLQDKTARAVAGEVNQGPYESAKNEVTSHSLQDRIDVRLGNGLEVLEVNEVNQIVIAGMGGPLIRDILEAGKEKLGAVQRIIVQPNIDSRSIRRWFLNNGYSLVEESILEESGHIYEILVAEQGDPEQPYDKKQIEKELWLGPYLLKQGGETFWKKCQEELDKKRYVLEQMKKASSVDQDKVDGINNEIIWLKEVLDYDRH
ncbi:tRNA (adenine(22)-N(1))-methyltransferase [Halobacillus mangrovi]|uniref:SAM-dependent methyltransferase n=1 Tax=Halobacillus mangrovi TaxID=402384 RepID=A0A1W5ZUW6_9BACI|nr:tRNA (adenine(22)-N(1))-methyltransferase TrmK [Halobacillus mangrovi]ARI77037.1 SAM-dependent methyltransferase [Halobacillus mangrovi]